ncbi:flavin monoamine oxidase family protein [Novosphingobium piscinae]|uniref:FAD-dependent oxidoreductase n=2 Tax=Novosphingobium piscinae TaxID=1507448 RepID=A0A7X1KQL7_9SPHN|nr:FAD-dependent oxidoreductase [Novosphingobium piscinae]
MGIDRRGFTLGAAGLGLTALAGAGTAAGAARPARSVKPAPGPAVPGRPDVVVLGAGVSGLQAAWLLEQQGLRVTVLEGRTRVGGRVMTLLDEPGYPEMGFNSMAEGYGRGIDAASRAGVELQEVGARYRMGPPPGLWINGQPLTREEWARFPGNPFPAALKAVMPAELVGRLVAERTRLKDWTAWTDPAQAGLDISLHDFLREQGLSDAAIRLAYDVSPYYGTSAYDVSALMMEYNDGFVKAQFAAGPKSLAVKGGNLHLPQGMARLLKGDVILGKEVTAIEAGATGCVVTCRDGSRFEAGRVVCSLPFSTLRFVSILPGLAGAQARAVATLPYQPLSIAFITAAAPFWEEDKLAPGMWTDGLTGTVIPQRYGATPEEITGFQVQARGALANYWDRLGRDGALRMIVAGLEAMRPAARGKLVPRAYFSWSQEAFNGGDWAYFGPGHVRDFATTMSLPAGRLHFCGEHTATGARGLEGALESAERAALEVLGA